MVRTVLLLLGTLAVLTLGAVGPSSAARAEAPCHSMAETSGSAVSVESRDPSHHVPVQPAKTMKSMACCVACVTAGVPTPAATAEPEVRAALLTPAASPLPSGSLLSPEPGPPRS